MTATSATDAERELADARERIRRAVSHIARSAYIPAFLRAQLLEMLVDAPEPLHDTVPCPPPAGAGAVRIATSVLVPNSPRAVFAFDENSLPIGWRR